MEKRKLTINNRTRKQLFWVVASIVVFITTYMLVLPALTIDEDTAIQDPGISNETLSQETVNELETVADPFTIEQEREQALNNTDTETITTDSSAVDSFDTQNTSATEEVTENNTQEELTPLKEEENTLSVSPDEDKISAVVEGDFYLFNYESEEINVFVKAPLNAFPEGTTMKVEPIEDEKVIDSVNAALESSKKKAKSVKAVDITFYDAQGNEVKPSCDINVSLKSNLIKESANTEVIHIDDNGTGTVVDQADQDTAEDEVAFDSKDFSPYVIAETIETEITISNENGNDETYLVKVTYGPEANIPDGATLRVREFDEGSEEYEYARNSVLADIKAKGEYVNIDSFNLAALDISIIDSNGNEIEPEAAVTVDLRIKELPGVDDLSSIEDELKIQHHVEVNDGVVVETVVEGKSEGSFEMNSHAIADDLSSVVDPYSINESDFNNSYSESPEIEYDFGDDINVSFSTEVFSTFTITWGGATNNNSTNLRWRYNNNNTRGQITVRYVNEVGAALTRPNGINGNYDIAVPNTNFENEVVFSASNVARAINNRTYQSAYILLDGVKTTVTRVVASRSGSNNYYTYSMSYYNGDTLVHSASGTGSTTFTRPDVYLQYSNSNTDNLATIHYGYMENGSFVEFEEEPSPATPVTNHHAYLIYDFDGYVYADHTYYRTTSTTGNPATGGTEIQARLHYTNNVWRYYTLNGTSGSNQNVADNSHIYVIYEEEVPATEGGSATTKPVEPGQEPLAPNIIKNSKVNGDGTNTLSLSVTGQTIDMEVEKLADVIVVFDVSGSMSNDISSNTNRGIDDIRSRMYQLKTAMNNLADTLLSEDYENSSGEKLINLSLVTFSNTASSASEFTDDADTFKGWIDDLGADGGTNWEKALYEANIASVDPERATFVIFVTDGEPTFRFSRMNVTDADLSIFGKDGNDDYYVDYNVFGNGSSDPGDYNYDAALIQAKSIVSNGKNLYTIGVGPEVSNLTTFGNEAGASGNYTATSSSALVDAFDEIIAEISSLMGWGDIEITDGITGLTNTVEKSGLINVDGKFEYWKSPAPSNWNTMTDDEKEAYVPDDSSFSQWDPSSENCQEAEYDEDSGAVLWDMGDKFVPADGVTYKVTFKVWPKQEAYDILAALQNGTISYSELDPDIQAQIDEETLTLKTNEDDAGYSYKTATKTGNTVTVTGDPISGTFPAVDPLIMVTDEVTVSKTWENAVDSTKPHDITLQVWGNGVLYKSFELTQDNDWTASDGYISCGLMTVNESTGHVEIYEGGHDFILKEVGEGSYYWDLKADTYHPMVINNERVTLVLVDQDSVPTGMSGDYYSDGTDKYYKIGENIYKYVSSASDGIVLTAVNEHRTYVDLSKIVVAGENNTQIDDNTEFTYTITLNDALGEENGNQGYLFFTVRDVAGRVNLDDSAVTTSADFYPVGGAPYFRVYTGDEFTLKVRQGWNVRFLNLPSNSTYSIEESDQENYEFVSITATEMSGDSTIPVDAEIDDMLITGRVTSSNAGHTIQYMNRVEARQVTLLKTTESGKGYPLSGAIFDLYTKAGYESDPKAEPLKTAIESSSDEEKKGQLDLGILPVGDYYLVETKAPDGFDLLTEAISLKVSNDKITIHQGNSERQDITPDDETFDAFITNTAGVILPHTGGSGTAKFYILGSMLIAGSLMYEHSLRRNSRKRKEVK